MAASRSHAEDDSEITGINVTPLVDVMLVLLVIFMVTATYIAKEAIQIALPRAANAAEITGRTLHVAITKGGEIYLEGIAVDEPSLTNKIRALVRDTDAKEIQALISADRASLHGKVVGLLDLLRSEGIERFAIQIEKVAGP